MSCDTAVLGNFGVGRLTSPVPSLSRDCRRLAWPFRHHGATLACDTGRRAGERRERESMARIQALCFATLLALVAGDAAAEISGSLVKIGVLNDQSGVYSDENGPGSVVAARMAVEDFGEVAPGVRVEV